MNVFIAPRGKLPHHYAAIGRLIVGFSAIERSLAEALREIIGVPEETGRALTGEMHAGDTIKTFVRVLDARRRDEIITNPERGVPITAEQLAAISEAIRSGRSLPEFVRSDGRPPNRSTMRQLFSEIERLNKVRDDVAHRHMLVRRREMSFSNWRTFRTPNRLSFNTYSIEELNEMADYAANLVKRVSLLLQPPSALQRELTRNPTLLEIPSRLRPPDKSRETRQERRRQQPP
jgi:hypothetical protein